MEREKELVANLSLLQHKMTGSTMITYPKHFSFLPAPLNPCYIVLDDNDSIFKLETVLNHLVPVKASDCQCTIGELNGVYAYFIGKSNPGSQEGQVFLMLQSTIYESNKPRLQSRHGVFNLMMARIINQTNCGPIQNILGGEITFRHGALIRWNAQSTVYSLQTSFNHEHYLAKKEVNDLPEAYKLLENISSAVKTVKLPYDKFTIYPYEEEQAPFIAEELSLLEERIGRSVPQLALNHNLIPVSSKHSPTSIADIADIAELNESAVYTARNYKQAILVRRSSASYEEAIEGDLQPAHTNEYSINPTKVYKKALSENTKSVEDTESNHKTID